LKNSIPVLFSALEGAASRGSAKQNKGGNMSLSRKAMLICVLSGFALRATPVHADTAPSAKTDAQTQEQTEEKRRTLMADATAALAETQGALKLLDSGKKNEALAASETVVTVANIPLATYPAAIKDAVRSIDANKIDEAKATLQAALNTQVLTETIIPLPVVYAGESLKEAETLAEKTDRTKARIRPGTPGPTPLRLLTLA